MGNLLDCAAYSNLPAIVDAEKGVAVAITINQQVATPEAVSINEDDRIRNLSEASTTQSNSRIVTNETRPADLALSESQSQVLRQMRAAISRTTHTSLLLATRHTNTELVKSPVKQPLQEPTQNSNNSSITPLHSTVSPQRAQDSETNNGGGLLQSSCPLPDSVLWQLQRQFYAQRNIGCWTGQDHAPIVPSMVSSNAFIGHSYAKMIVDYIRDLNRAGQLDLKEPLYVLELGSGSGKLGFHIATRLLELEEFLPKLKHACDDDEEEEEQQQQQQQDHDFGRNVEVRVHGDDDDDGADVSSTVKSCSASTAADDDDGVTDNASGAGTARIKGRRREEVQHDIKVDAADLTPTATRRTITTKRMQKSKNELCVRVVISDFSEELIRFWLSHPPLRALMEKGILDVAVLDAENDSSFPHELKLLHSGLTVTSPTTNPLVCMSNYVFNSLRQDSFQIRNGKLMRGQVSLQVASTPSSTSAQRKRVSSVSRNNNTNSKSNSNSNSNSNSTATSRDTSSTRSRTESNAPQNPRVVNNGRPIVVDEPMERDFKSTELRQDPQHSGRHNNDNNDNNINNNMNNNNRNNSISPSRIPRSTTPLSNARRSAKRPLQMSVMPPLESSTESTTPLQLLPEIVDASKFTCTWNFVPVELDDVVDEGVDDIEGVEQTAAHKQTVTWADFQRQPALGLYSHSNYATVPHDQYTKNHNDNCDDGTGTNEIDEDLDTPSEKHSNHHCGNDKSDKTAGKHRDIDPNTPHEQPVNHDNIDDDYDDRTDANEMERVVLCLLKELIRHSDLHDAATVLVPIGAFNILTQVALFSCGRMLLLTGDKGHNRVSDMAGLRTPHLNVHGSFSFTVNFHLLERFAEVVYGAQVMQTAFNEGFKCSATFMYLDSERHGGKARSNFLKFQAIGKSFPRFPDPNTGEITQLHTRIDQTFKRSMASFMSLCESFGPEQFSMFQRCVKDEAKFPSLRQILALLRLGRGDQDVFYKFRHSMIDRIAVPYCSDPVQYDAKMDVGQVLRHYYPLQRSRDVSFELGRLHMALKEYTQAVALFDSSNEQCGEHYVTHHNTGICYYCLGKMKLAKNAFERSLELHSGYTEARTWLDKVEVTLTHSFTRNDMVR